MCVATSDLPARQCFAFLERVRQQYNFVKQSGGAGESDSFDSDLKDLAESYGDPDAGRTAIILAEMRSIKEAMTESISAVVKSMDDISPSEQETVVKFKSNPKVMIYVLWWKNRRLWIILGSLLLVRT